MNSCHYFNLVAFNILCVAFGSIIEQCHWSRGKIFSCGMQLFIRTFMPFGSLSLYKIIIIIIKRPSMSVYLTFTRCAIPGTQRIWLRWPLTLVFFFSSRQVSVFPTNWFSENLQQSLMFQSAGWAIKLQFICLLRRWIMYVATASLCALVLWAVVRYCTYSTCPTQPPSPLHSYPALCWKTCL